jgi:hypothetical protein
MAIVSQVPLHRASWRVLHDAKNDLAAATLLLGRMRAGHAVDPELVETLIRRAAVRLDDIPANVRVAIRVRA